MRRFSLWLRGKPLVADAILAALLLLLDISLVPHARHRWIYAVTSVALIAPAVLRRHSPRAMAAATLVLSVCGSLSAWLWPGQPAHPTTLELGLFLYTLVAYVSRRDAVCYALGLGADLALAAGTGGLTAGTAALGVTLYALCWITAEFIGARHAYDAEVQARLAVADYDRERSAHEAVAAERTRIARELHDVVAHAVSVMIVQADGASYALDRDQAAARTALANISDTGRQALNELRRTVALLRTEHAPEELPQHGTAGIASVVALMRTAGLAVDLEQTGNIDDIPAGVSLGVHRIIQESLTNTLRHAGPDARANVRVARRDDRVVVDITDSAARHSGTNEPQTIAIRGSGLGLVGMRERIAVLGGTLEAGRGSDGNWRVMAMIPLQSR